MSLHAHDLFAATEGRRKPPAWASATLDAERALNSDDGHAAVLARRAMEKVAAAPLAESCPDPALYRMFQEACTRWSAHHDPILRQRWEDPCRALARAVHGLAAESVRARRLDAADRARARAGLPRGDR